MKCPYCGNDEPDKFMYPFNDEESCVICYITCLVCNGEFEHPEIEYYKEEDLGPFPETSIRLDDLPKTLRWLRKMREMTLKETSKKSGLSVSFLSDMERGRVRPSLETLQKLAITYKAPLSIYLPSDPTAIKNPQEEGESEEDRLISFSAVIQVLNKEIDWCNSNRGVAPGPDGDWFIKGLEQAKYLIVELSKLREDDPLANKPVEDSPTGIPGYMGDYGGIPHGPFDI
jgi:transcriptional regulator with XRE-family HTH domain